MKKNGENQIGLIRIETSGLDILKCVGLYPDISDPSNPDSVSNQEHQF